MTLDFDQEMIRWVLEGILTAAMGVATLLIRFYSNQVKELQSTVQTLRDNSVPKSELRDMRQEILGAIHGVETNVKENVLDRLKDLEHEHGTLQQSHNDLRVTVASMQQCMKD